MRQHPQCQFPARYAWLKEELGFDSAHPPQQTCLRFKKWRSKLDVESVAMIFAAAYMDNPASMYGHTFLRLNRKGHKGSERLLDYAVNFSAVTNTRSGILFAMLGLMGGYEGHFSTLPYYIKVQEYTNLQSRDLWEYQLNLTDEQIDRLVNHLWEMGSTYFDYYFLDENCSYQLLPLLEIADPSLHLTDAFGPRVIPIDTVRILMEQPGLVSDVFHRPSHMNEMLERRSFLSSGEIQVAERIAAEGDESGFRLLEQYPIERRRLILDTAYDFFRYRAGFTRDQSRKVKLHERHILLNRRKLGVGISKSESENSENTPDPVSGHKTGRFGIAFGVSQNRTFEEISLRPALHDLVSFDTGYIPDSHLEMFHLRLRFDNEMEKGFIEEIRFVEIVSLTPFDSWIRKPSWKFGFGFDLAKELGCIQEVDCLYFGLNAGRGYTVKTMIWKGETLYLLPELDFGVGGVFDDNYRLGGGGTSGILLNLSAFWRINVEGTYLHYPLGDKRPNAKVGIKQVFRVSDDINFRLNLQREGSYKEALFMVSRYF
ncbi:MAG: DUF4105 domain-containing protein [Nitrospiria bacterium]